VLILLPPSESKSSPANGLKLSFPSLWLEEKLTAPRIEVCNALVALANGPRKRATDVLGLTPGLAGEVAHDAVLLTAPCAPAIEIYTGVLYEALGWKSLPATAKKRGEMQLRIFSALFGALRPLDPIPPYRLGMTVNLPKLGGLGAYWKRHLASLDEQERDVVIDMRSHAYARTWTPTIAETAMVRVFVEKSGKRSVVSHMAKKTRGEVARALLNLKKSPTDIDGTAHALSDAFDLELVRPETARKPYLLDVILRS